MTSLTTTATNSNRMRDLTPQQVKAGMDSGELMVIDVREPSEFAGERIPGAKLMPLTSFDPAKLTAMGDCRIVLHCKAGTRSAKAAQLLLNSGYEQAFQLQGGIDAWKQAGLPIERDAKSPISMFRQVQITAGSLALIGSLLGFFVSSWFFLLSGFIGTGLLFAGLTDSCGMAMLLAKMPWNRVR